MSTPYHQIAAGSANDKTLVRKGLTMLKGWYGFNTDATLAFVNLYDAAAAGDVTVGTTVPKWKICLPLNSTAANGTGANAGGFNIKFDLGIVIAFTDAVALATTNGVAANTVVINLEID